MGVADWYRRASGLWLPKLNFSQPHPHPCPNCCSSGIEFGCCCSHCIPAEGETGTACDPTRLNAPGTFQVVIDGVTGAGVCTDYNDTFILLGCSQTTPTNSCWWQYIFPPDDYYMSFMRVWIGYNKLASEYRIDVIMYKAGGGSFAWWRKGYAEPVDCMNLVDESIPLLGLTPSCGGTPTCLVTGL